MGGLLYQIKYNSGNVPGSYVKSTTKLYVWNCHRINCRQYISIIRVELIKHSQHARVKITAVIVQLQFNKMNKIACALSYICITYGNGL